MGSQPAEPMAASRNKDDQILDAVLAVLARDGISGVSMRAVAREGGVALGLMNYYFNDKTALIAAALRRLGEQDAELVEPVLGCDAREQLVRSLRRVAADEFLSGDYLALRLQLWALVPVDPVYASINRDAQERYRDGLAALIAVANPVLDASEVARRAADVLVIQNGIWLTSLLIVDRPAIDRAVGRCEEIALAP
ncbi:MAG: TetR family transcriptional regulator [Actinomycetes bacterium]